MPLKTVYQEGEYFDPTGMIVMAKNELKYGSGNFYTTRVRTYTVEDDGPLTKGQRSVCISYENEGSQRKITRVNVTVEGKNQ